MPPLSRHSQAEYAASHSENISNTLSAIPCQTLTTKSSFLMTDILSSKNFLSCQIFTPRSIASTTSVICQTDCCFQRFIAIRKTPVEARLRFRTMLCCELRHLRFAFVSRACQTHVGRGSDFWRTTLTGRCNSGIPHSPMA